MTLLIRLADRFWSWENRRHAPDTVLNCVVCGTPVRRADAFGGRCCSQEHLNDDIANGL